MGDVTRFLFPVCVPAAVLVRAIDAVLHVAVEIRVLVQIPVETSSGLVLRL